MKGTILRLIIIFLLLFGAGAVSHSFAQGPDSSESPDLDLSTIKERVFFNELDNGLQILTYEDHRTPIVFCRITFRVGSRDERPGITGISHLLEHLMFKGTDQMGTDIKNHLWKAYLANGASFLNASTSNDTTQYYVTLPSNKLELFFALESDRMKNPIFREFETERDVVKEERRLRTENSPSGMADELLDALAFTTHPYHWPVVGWMTDLNAIKIEDAESYFKTYYNPANAVLVITGDIDPTQALTFAQKYFGDWKEVSNNPGSKGHPVEPAQKGERRGRIILDSRPIIFIGYHRPPPSDEDDSALTLLSQILTGGETGKLRQRLVLEKGIASSVSSYADSRADGGLFTIMANPISQDKIGEVEEEIYSVLKEIQEKGREDSDLKKAKAQLTAQFIYTLESLGGIAGQLSFYQLHLGDWQRLLTRLNDLNAVTSDDIRGIVSTYFKSSNRTVIIVGGEGS